MKPSKNTIVIAVLIGLLVLAMGLGFFLGKKYYDKDPPSSNAVIDSLLNVNKALIDSIKNVEADIRYVDKIRIKYRDRIDTIRVYEDPDALLKSLRKIANTPPQ